MGTETSLRSPRERPAVVAPHPPGEPPFPEVVQLASAFERFDLATEPCIGFLACLQAEPLGESAGDPLRPLGPSRTCGDASVRLAAANFFAHVFHSRPLPRFNRSDDGFSNAGLANLRILFPLRVLSSS